MSYAFRTVFTTGFFIDNNGNRAELTEVQKMLVGINGSEEFHYVNVYEFSPIYTVKRKRDIAEIEPSVRWDYWQEIKTK